ncbi:MAG: transcription-repair coupling factor [Gammaproteobacteria bacterium]
MADSLLSVFDPLEANPRRSAVRWGRLYGEADTLAVAELVRKSEGLTLIVTPDTPSADRFEAALGYFLAGADIPVLHLPDWETLPYDVFSPHQDIISQRLTTLVELGQARRGALVVPISTLMQRLAPRAYLDGSVFMLKVGDTLDTDAMRLKLEAAGYTHVGQVMEHGEYTTRGSLFDLFPMGSEHPYRIDLFDDEIDSIRTFDPETQLTEEKVDEIRLLPGREFPMDKDGIAHFRHAYREAFEGDPTQSVIYKDVSNGLAPGGIEYYLPLFFDDTASLFDYLPAKTQTVTLEGVDDAADAFWNSAHERYTMRKNDFERPALPPLKLFLEPSALGDTLDATPRVSIQGYELPDAERKNHGYNYDSHAPGDYRINARADEPAALLKNFLGAFQGRVLFAAESAGRREVLQGLLRDQGIRSSQTKGWQGFLESTEPVCIGIAPLDKGLQLDQPHIAVITENQLFGDRVQQQRRRRKKAKRDPDALVRDLTELQIGAPVVHEDQGVGRYLGLQTLDVGGMTGEFLTLEYSGGDKLYVPVSALHLISRYTGADADNAPMHKLGGEQWQRIKKKAAEKVRDVAAELLDLYARREAKPGHSIRISEPEYASFASDFPFEETPDQETAITAVLGDLKHDRPMDRVVCGDVGFGKTEVAMRAAFAAAQDGGQVAVLVPTTLLAQQHYQNFQDRFAEWPVRLQSLSRFGGGKQQAKVLKELEEGKIDIVVGTHKLLQPSIKFKNLRLVIIDEEQRFGVRQKEALKNLRAEVDMLTLTATPIPRTLNMSLSGIRDLSIIATPPAQRHAIKTFVSQWNDATIQEACLRELKRGGQVYFLHNKVENIEDIAKDIEKLVPEARVDVAHGQMRETQLERVMTDFYHRRFNILVCTTIIESGIDVPNANTIIINRADKLGLAQLHQIRGRVGRSHHRAYAYLITPPPKTMTADAKKRLAAIESMEDLGAGFALATHDLEIRGAGELLGEGQSGQIQEIGFGLYMDMLNRTVEALKSGKQPELDRPLGHGTEVDLRIPALMPEDYVPDVHLRLIMYKRIANAANSDELRELQVEMIDRFGLLPDAAKNLFAVTELKLKATPMGIKKIEANAGGGRFTFEPQANINAGELIGMIQKMPDIFRMQGQEKLNFEMDLEDPQERLKAIEELLDRLAIS